MKELIEIYLYAYNMRQDVQHVTKLMVRSGSHFHSAFGSSFKKVTLFCAKRVVKYVKVRLSF